MKKILSFILLTLTVTAYAATITDNSLKIGKGASNKTIVFDKGSGTGNPQFRWNNSTSKLQFSNDGTNFTDFATASGINARWVLEDAIVPYNYFDALHYQAGTQSLTTLNLSLLNSGTSGSTTVRIDQIRAGVVINYAFASIAASSGNPSGTQATLTGFLSGSELSLVAGDQTGVSVTAVADGLPEGLAVEY